MSQVLTQAKTKKLIWMIFKMTDRIDEINEEMKKMNDAFTAERAVTDFEYLHDYHTTMAVLSEELRELLGGEDY